MQICILSVGTRSAVVLLKSTTGLNSSYAFCFGKTGRVLNVLPVLCALSAFAEAMGHGVHLTKQDGILLAYRVSRLFSRFYPQRVSANIRTPGLDQVCSSDGS